MPNPIKRGALIEYPSLVSFSSYPSPYIVVSGDALPFYGEEYVGLAITPTDSEAAVPVPDGAWIRGGLPKPSFVKPWQPTLLKHDDVIDAFGVVEPSLVDRTVEALVDVVGG